MEQHPVLSVPAALAAAASGVLGTSGVSLTLPEVRTALTGLVRAQAAVDAARLHLVRMLLEREQPGDPDGATVHWMTHTLRTGRAQARADVAAARAVSPEDGALPALGAALAAGEVLRAHVDVAVRALRHLPTGLIAGRGGDLDLLLTDHARAFSPPDATTLARHLVATAAPDGLDAFEDHAHERRSWDVRTDRTGMVCATGQLDPAGGATYLAVLDHLATPDRLATPDSSTPAGATEALPFQDRRTLAQRRADAQVQMARLAATALGLAHPSSEPPRVVIHCTPDQLAHTPGTADTEDGCAHPGPATCEQTGPISATTLHRHACDAILDRVVLDRHGALVSMESLGRLATTAQRRALTARDGGCTWPACSAPASWCEAHHITWWSRGGPTALTNLALLCPRHHTEIHTEHWTIQMHEGVPWFTPPPWIDPDRRPVRNTLHIAITRTHRATRRLLRGEQLTLDDLAPPGTAPPGTAPPGTAPPHAS